MKKRRLLLTLSMLLGLSTFLAACGDAEEVETNDSEVDEIFGDVEPADTDFESDTSTYEEEESDSPYTEEELEADPEAPSTNPDDYDSNGQYVPATGPSDNSEDYDANGNYAPVEDMTDEEIEAELESILEGSFDE